MCREAGVRRACSCRGHGSGQPWPIGIGNNLLKVCFKQWRDETVRVLCLFLVFFTLLFEGEPHHLFSLSPPPIRQAQMDISTNLLRKDCKYPPRKLKAETEAREDKRRRMSGQMLCLCCHSAASHRRPTVKQILSLVPVSVSEINMRRFFLCTLYTAGTSVNGALCSLRAAIRGSPLGLRKGWEANPSILPAFLF